mmetsp:Transcript_20111/g.33875  ORF Transcript_20111/g.33875 Transcript_20111/m.33875 type:complete len:166 (+) Transcript_20111:121-618(+)|eukprot:CAMPEP_0114422982 /NCGR_PEP_ID=MMETSP0103-20121206/5901_1 /TAXON_ID=37642 ORGANISM="Paraphysomonas imperforata, Strain PA2" /NCGR_SAMPLE_ID=MMETSP0103 /ASSEMBLY_ACC=CAM_ASM_000201 /LENGTH=165 /DNA_ID=CAMNT_0001591605 /DNA_START=133 /DNA_END=630 /DNA_ORIENTATION=+
MNDNNNVSLISLVDNFLSGRISNDEEVDVEEVLSIYSFITHDKPKLIEVALEVIDKQDNHRIIQVVSESTNRSFHLVQGSRAQKYLILPNYCPCQSFSHLFNHITEPAYTGNATRRTVTQSLCKHMLAVKMATSLNRIDKRSVSDDKFMEIFKSSQREDTQATSM